jgi:hypothetical protein
MATVTKSRKPVKPVSGYSRWIGGTPSLAALDNGNAMLLIAVEGKTPQAYHVQRTSDSRGIAVGYRLTKAGVESDTVYDVEEVPQGGEKHYVCDCPDATYRDRATGCKHSKALKAALAAVGSK